MLSECRRVRERSVSRCADAAATVAAALFAFAVADCEFNSVWLENCGFRFASAKSPNMASIESLKPMTISSNLQISIMQTHKRKLATVKDRAIIRNKYS